MRQERQYKDTTPELEHINKPRSSSVYVGYYKDRYFERSWHHHPEYELILISRGHGQRYVGDHSERFSEGDLVLMGPQLPHAWISDPEFYHGETEHFSTSIYIQFNRSVFEHTLFQIEEFHGIKNLLSRSARGLKITGRIRKEVRNLMEGLPDASALDRLLALFKMLNLIETGQVRYLASEQYLSEKVFFKSKRMNRIHQHMVENFRQEISLDELAELVNMTRSSFCRFFKSQTGRTCTRYLSRIRIDFASKLLQDTDMQIKEIGYECGFSSISYFNQTFKKYHGISPRQFRTIG